MPLDSAGETVYNEFTLPKNQRVLQIDFENDDHRNVPPSITLETPGRPLVSLSIHNIGPGRLRYDTVTTSNSYRANALLLPGEKTELQVRDPVITKLNLVANVDDCFVRLLGLY